MAEGSGQQRLEEAFASVFGERIFALPHHAWTEFGLTFGVRPQDAKEVFRTLRDHESFLFNMLIDVTAVDWLDSREPRFDVVYQFLSLTHLHRLCAKVQVDEMHPEVDSVVDLWPAANFLEREVWDMFGITFRGHGDLRRILLYEEFVGHPLRKDYPLRGRQPRTELRVPELRDDSGDMLRQELVAMPTRKGSSEEAAN